MNETISSNKFFYLILLSLVLITTVNVILHWEEAYFFMYLALHLLGILCISGGVVTEKKNEESVNYMCVIGLVLLLAVQGIMKYSSFSLQDFSLLIDVLP
ncbi:hypothetical protein CN300_12625 [Bacillus thuringiensis]|uniref:DUF2101 domain-containing protein n=1 Tax=Bacillus cereus TaxID=1396 RepID=A0A9X6UR14_BACCE|nr:MULTISPECIES: DUF2101 family protein [Bacillus cereus group]PEC14331.1 hypothetical protein CON19_23915 [Bacillus thuringiensis]PEQ92498.1 hypothetical protein CN475_01165 [Bacillus cereus]PEV07597.1 hypothetical protein CN418_25920 [Bacillus thuringiensis]PFC45112.1 hypothetical protein CN300_12625 [Bacillus thuringiensis]PGV72951.1 hypothetical protein COD96_05145 [Bacillus thuringiensis]